ncbi:MAG: protein translocase subunit SecDF [Saprospiraceae bacterium]|nr:protein translocase subunit SecDF [Saprospiraceae bacterium]
MQSKGAIRLFAIVFAIVCLYQLSFTLFTSRTEKKSKEYAISDKVRSEAITLAHGDTILEGIYFDSLSRTAKKYYLDSMSDEVIYNIGVRKYTYADCKEREINLGLDLKGGMNVTLEVSVVDIVRSMSGFSEDSVFNLAINKALQMQKSSPEGYVTLFAKAFKEIDPNARLATVFSTIELKDKINPNSTDEEVLAVIYKETSEAIDRTFEILRTRIDQFGVAQPNIQKMQTAGRILVELPGVKDPARVRKLLQGTAHLEFWKTYDFSEISSFLMEANEKITDYYKGIDNIDTNLTQSEDSLQTINETLVNDDEAPTLLEKMASNDTAIDSISSDTSTSLVDKLKVDSAANALDQQTTKTLFSYLQPNVYQNEGQYYPGKGPVMGRAEIRDTARINNMLKLESVKNIFPRDLKWLWTVKPIKNDKGFITTTLELVALKKENNGQASMNGDVVTNARQDFSQNGGNEISMTMNTKGAKIWKKLTGDNIGKSIAIVLDNYVYSYPTVQGEIPGGRSSITGDFTLEEAKDLANILKAGKIPAPARIVEEAIVGPSLGKEAVNAGLISFIIAFIMVLLYMILYYNRAGVIANIALITNVFFLFGVLASLGAVLTLPGIAGIVLTLGMAVDANVIIFERIKEEIRAGKGARLAIADGYKNAYSAIIDGNVTTLLTGIVLFIFGSGPIQGFATTLIIGILTSLFSAIFLSRLVFTWMLDRNKMVNFDNKFTRNFLVDSKIDFVGLRKKMFIVSGIIIVIGIISLSTKSLNYGVDFAGGRTYIVRFDQNVNTVEVSNALTSGFKFSPEVKTFGQSDQVKITTKYKIEVDSVYIDSLVERKLYEGVKGFYKTPITYEEFLSDSDSKIYGKLSSQKVFPTIADDIKRGAFWALTIALIIIFLYIAARFRKWQFGLGGLAALVHDSFITVSLYSIFYGILPFNLEVDQAFIAAILTIIGYSINDTVIIFDRIREYLHLYPKRTLKENMNSAINSTLARTINTAGTTIIVLLTIFIFGGEVIRGFTFALMVGILVGTYSSIFIASPISYNLMKIQEKKKELKKLLTKRKK